MTKSLIYYTDNRVLKDNIIEICQEQLLKANLPIFSCSLKPINFGKNVVLENRERSYPTMVKQNVMVLEEADTDIVFFVEHDVLYDPSHFDFTPEDESIYYYNLNNYRWDYPNDRLITYSGLTSLSQLCCYRKTALEHFKKRLEYIEENEWDKQRSREPRWGRKMGYEPGTKPRRRGGFSDETYETWKSEKPNIDIRHTRTFSSPKIDLASFKHKPDDWKEVALKDITNFDLKSIFNL